VVHAVADAKNFSLVKNVQTSSRA